MNRLFLSLLTGIALTAGAYSAKADSTVATIPDAMISLPITHGTTNFLSIPVTNPSIYSGTVTTFGPNFITVDDNPAPFTTNYATPAAPYFLRFLTGNEAGRVVLVVGNTSNMVQVDVTDHISGETVSLSTARFNLQAGDAFEIFPGDTLATVLGDGSSANPLVITGGVNNAQSDIVSLYTSTNTPTTSYYFNTNSNSWLPVGGTVKSNNVVIYPYSAFTVLARPSHADTFLTLSGRVTQVGPATKLVSRGSVYTSTHYATDIKLSDLQFEANWTRGTNVISADTISVWNPTLNAFQVFYQRPDSTWRSSTDARTDQSSYVIPAGTVTSISKKIPVAGATAFLVQANLPYSL